MHTPHKTTPTTGSNQTAGEVQNDLAIIGDTDHKRFSTLAARAALLGHTLQEAKSGYILSRWTHSRHFANLDTAQTLIDRMESPASTAR